MIKKTFILIFEEIFFECLKNNIYLTFEEIFLLILKKTFFNVKII